MVVTCVGESCPPPTWNTRRSERKYPIGDPAIRTGTSSVDFMCTLDMAIAVLYASNPSQSLTSSIQLLFVQSIYRAIHQLLYNRYGNSGGTSDQSCVIAHKFHATAVFCFVYFPHAGTSSRPRAERTSISGSRGSSARCGSCCRSCRTSRAYCPRSS